MKKKGLLLGLATCMATALSAQIYTVKTSLNELPRIIPGEYTSDGKTMLYITEFDDAGSYSVHFYDQDFKEIKTVDLNLPVNKSYDMVKARESEIRRTYEDERPYTIYGNTGIITSREEMIEYLTQRVDTVYEDKDGIMWFVESFYDEYQYHNGKYYTYTSYPEYGYYLTVDNKVFEFSYSYDRFYDGEWKQEMKIENYSSVSLPSRMEICGVANGIPIDYSCDWTQCLFNNDAKMEYFYITEEPKATGSYEYDRDNDGIVDSIATRYSYYPTKIELKQEDGTVLFTHNKSMEGTQGIYPYFFRLDERDYLIIREYELYSSSITYTFYAVDKNASSIAEVNSIKGLRAWPNPAEKNGTLTMELPESQNENMERDIRVTSMDGRLMWQQRVSSGSGSVQIPLRGMNSGIYNFTLTEGGRVIENSRIIVK